MSWLVAYDFARRNIFPRAEVTLTICPIERAIVIKCHVIVQERAIVIKSLPLKLAFVDIQD